MAVLGLSLIAERADANITATERVLDSVQQSNQLMAIQASLVQGLRQGLEIHAEWLKIPLPKGEKGITVTLGLDWTELVRAADNMQNLLEMAKQDFLSSETLLEAAQAYGVLPDFVNPIVELARLRKEGRVRKSLVDMKSTPGSTTPAKSKSETNMANDRKSKEKVSQSSG